MFFEIIFIMIIFIIVLFLTYFSTKFIANTKIKTMKNNNMQIIETISIGFHNLYILKINEKFYLISSSKDGIRYLTQLEKEDINFSNEQKKLSFEENLKKYFKNSDKIGGKNEK